MPDALPTTTEPIYKVSLGGMCDCARTREFCVTRGCKRETFEWRFSTEGRDEDHLRRIIDLRLKGRPVSRWIRPERAIAEAWLMNMERRSVSAMFIEKLGRFAIDTKGEA